MLSDLHHNGVQASGQSHVIKLFSIDSQVQGLVKSAQASLLAALEMQGSFYQSVRLQQTELMH